MYGDLETCRERHRVAPYQARTVPFPACTSSPNSPHELLDSLLGRQVQLHPYYTDFLHFPRYSVPGSGAASPDSDMDDALWNLDHGLWNPMAIDDSESHGMMILTLISLCPYFHRCRTESAHPTGGNALNVQGNIKSTSVPRGHSEAGSCVVRGLNRVWAFRRAKGKQGGHLTPPSGCCIAETYDAGGGQLSQAPSLSLNSHTPRCTGVNIISTWDVGPKAMDCSVSSCAHGVLNIRDG